MHPTTTRALIPATLVLLLGMAGCAAAPRALPAEDGTPPLQIAGQTILVLPVQDAAETGGRLDTEIAYALRERGAHVTWVDAEALRRALRRSPGLGGDPSALPADPLLHGGERRAESALLERLRRYTALADARLALLPRLAPGDGGGGARLSAALIDSRTGTVVWWSELAPPEEADPRAAAVEWAGALARRLIAAPATGGER